MLGFLSGSVSLQGTFNSQHMSLNIKKKCNEDWILSNSTPETTRQVVLLKMATSWEDWMEEERAKYQELAGKCGGGMEDPMRPNRGWVQRICLSLGHWMWGLHNRRAIKNISDGAVEDPWTTRGGLIDPGWVTWVSDVVRPETPSEPGFVTQNTVLASSDGQDTF